MNPHSEQAAAIQAYIDSHRQAGTSDEQISMQLLQAGWPLAQVHQALTAGTPHPSHPVLNNMTTQTGNAGTPLQVENVQYNMNVKSVQSKVGLYIRITGLALWSTVIILCFLLASIVERVGGNGGSIAATFVFTLSLSAVTTPIFIVAYRKFLAERRKNPATNDDLFFKRSVRNGLWVAIVFGAISAVSTLYQLLGAAFLKDSTASYTTGFSNLIFALGFGGIVYFYWRLHAKTQR